MSNVLDHLDFHFDFGKKNKQNEGNKKNVGKVEMGVVADSGE